MVTCTPNTVTHPNCGARDAAGVILANVRGVTMTDAVRVLARAESRGNAPIGRAEITHTGYVRNAAHFDASTALYRITIGRLI
jgi:hypothetical protein